MADVSGNRSLGQRENQEDAFAIIAQNEKDISGDLLMIVSDGMGGHAGGEVASNLVVKTFQDHFVSGSTAHKPRDRLLESAHASNAAIKARINTEPSLKGMGCTLVAGLKYNDRLIWVSIGDSHVYLYRESKLIHLNADHSVYGELVELVKAGKITQAEANAHPRRNALRSAIIGTELALIDINAIKLQHGDLIVLATDGLDSLTNDKIAALLAGTARADSKTITNLLLTAVKDVGRSKQDNTTVVAYRHSATDRSTWSADSKWKWSPKAKAGLSPNLRNAGFLIAGLFVLAVLIGFLAFRPASVSKSDSNGSAAESQGNQGDKMIEEAIGGGEARTPDSGKGDAKEGDSDNTDGADTGEEAGTDASEQDKDTTTDLGSEN